METETQYQVRRLSGTIERASQRVHRRERHHDEYLLVQSLGLLTRLYASQAALLPR